MINHGIVSAASKYLESNCVSSTSTELKALSKGALTVQAFRNVLADIHLKLHDATVLQGDNKSAITVAECPGAHRSKLAHLENSGRLGSSRRLNGYNQLEEECGKHSRVYP